MNLAGRTAATLASAYVQTGELDSAYEWAARAVAELAGGDIDGRGAALFTMAVVDTLRGDLAGALATLRRSIDELEPLRRLATSGPAAGPWGEEPTVDRARSLAAEHGAGFLFYSLISVFAPHSTLDAHSDVPLEDAAGLHVWYIDAHGVTHGAVDVDEFRAVRSSRSVPPPLARSLVPCRDRG